MPVVVSCVPGRSFAPSVSAGFRKAYRVEVGQILTAHPGSSVVSKQGGPTLNFSVTVCASFWIEGGDVIVQEFVLAALVKGEINLLVHTEMENWALTAIIPTD